MSATGPALFDIDAYLARSGALDLSGIDWADVARHPLPAQAIRTLKYMQDIESHTIVYLRSLLATRAIDDPDVARFLACWVYEESFHGLALERFLAAAGHPVGPRPTPHGHESPAQWLEARVTALLSRVWPDFCAVHMTWGAINELTTLTGYRRLAEVAGHPVLADLLAQIMRDESRHFGFYFDQAERRLAASATARRVTRLLVNRFWDPVGAGVQPDAETRFLAGYLFAGPDGRAAARTIDRTIRRLPGFADVALLEAWVDRHCAAAELAAPRRGNLATR